MAVVLGLADVVALDRAAGDVVMGVDQKRGLVDPLDLGVGNFAGLGGGNSQQRSDAEEHCSHGQNIARNEGLLVSDKIHASHETKSCRRTACRISRHDGVDPLRKRRGRHGSAVRPRLTGRDRQWRLHQHHASLGPGGDDGSLHRRQDLGRASQSGRDGRAWRRFADFPGGK